jgi:hypothetical protein
VTPSPDDPVYRSRKAALQERIAVLEAELASLRRDLSGLPPNPLRWGWIALASAGLLVAVLVGFLTLKVRSIGSLEFIPTFHNGGWTLSIRLPGSAKCKDAMLDRHDGSLERIDCVTRMDGSDLSSVGLTFEQASEPVKLYVDYDMGGRSRRGSIQFDPAEAKTHEVKKTLAMVPQWIGVRDMSGRRLLYFTTLVSYGFGLKEIRYGYDDAPLDRRVRFTVRDRIGVDNDDELFTDVPQDARSVTVEVVFADGTTSKRTFPTTPTL